MSFPVLYQGQVCLPESLGFPINDYGFLYGVGLFETVGVVSGCPLLLTEHLDRLYSGAEALRIPLSVSKSSYRDAIVTYLAHFESSNTGRLNLYVTAGDRVTGAPIGAFGEPMMMAVFRPSVLSRQPLSLAVRTQQFRREPHPQLKSMCYMGSILEKRAADGFDDVLLMDAQGALLETAFATVFLVQSGEVVTPKSESILDGITRAFLMNHQLDLGVSIRETVLTSEDLSRSDEIFLAQSTLGIVPVSSVEGFPALSSGSIAESLVERVWCLMQEASQ